MDRWKVRYSTCKMHQKFMPSTKRRKVEVINELIKEGVAEVTAIEEKT